MRLIARGRFAWWMTPVRGTEDKRKIYSLRVGDNVGGDRDVTHSAAQRERGTTAVGERVGATGEV